MPFYIHLYNKHYKDTSDDRAVMFVHVSTLYIKKWESIEISSEITFQMQYRQLFMAYTNKTASVEPHCNHLGICNLFI